MVGRNHLYLLLMDQSCLLLLPETNITIIQVYFELFLHYLYQYVYVLHVIIICQGWKRQTFEKVLYLSGMIYELCMQKQKEQTELNKSGSSLQEHHWLI